MLLFYFMLRQCNCAETPPPPVELAPVEPAPGVFLLDAAPVAPLPAVKPPHVAKAPRHRGRMKPRSRPRYRNKAPSPQSWLPEFRLQVAARGPRLSRCFEGAERPGALKWTATVDTARGIVSDHHFEAVLTGATLSKTLRACLVHALSTPPYGLSTEDGRSSPSRVSIVIEF